MLTEISTGGGGRQAVAQYARVLGGAGDGARAGERRVYAGDRATDGAAEREGAGVDQPQAVCVRGECSLRRQPAQSNMSL